MSAQDCFRRHAAAQRRMQSGVAADMATGGAPENKKHLRVGLNTALVDHASLTRLLMAKGLISEEEYAEAIAEGMEAEVRRFEELLSKRTGRSVSLGEAGSLPLPGGQG